VQHLGLIPLRLYRIHLLLSAQLSKKYGSVFAVYFGTRKVVVLAGYKAVKEALVSFAEEFGDRDISPIFNDTNRGHGMTFMFSVCANIFYDTKTQTE